MKEMLQIKSIGTETKRAFNGLISGWDMVEEKQQSKLEAIWMETSKTENQRD